MFKFVSRIYLKSLKPSYCFRGLTVRNLCTSFYDPPYLDALKPKIPIYESLNVQMKSYDFAVLENYQKFVNKIAQVMDITVEDGWATPATSTKIQKFKPNSSITESEYVLTTYERNIQITDVPSTVASVFFEMIQAGLPQGVSISIHKSEEEHQKIRYVPDMELKELKTLLDSLGGPITKKRSY